MEEPHRIIVSYGSTSLYGVTSVNSVGVKGDQRVYGPVIAIRAVTTDDFMTGDWARLPFDVLAIISARITNEIKSVV